VRPRAITCLGLAVLVVGTFLPWLHSGLATRNSYATDGAMRRLLRVGGAANTALRAWPFLSLLCAVAAALLLLGHLRTALAAAVVAALVGGGVAVWALTTSSGALVRPAPVGPIVTAVGAALTLVGVLACARSSRRRRVPGGKHERTE
jgi:hypothetical protein